QMALHDPTFFLPGELMKDPAQARANLAIHRFATVLRNKHHVILALPARMRQALPRFCHTVLLRISHQAILGGLYSRIAQSSSSRTRRTSGLPPLESYLNLPDPAETRRECSVQTNQPVGGEQGQAVASVLYDLGNDLGLRAARGPKQAEQNLLFETPLAATQAGDVLVCARAYAD